MKKAEKDVKTYLHSYIKWRPFTVWQYIATVDAKKYVLYKCIQKSKARPFSTCVRSRTYLRTRL